MHDSETAARKQRAFAMRYKVQTAAKGILALLLPLALVFAVLGGNFWRIDYRERDAANSPLQSGTAVVTTMTQVIRKQGFQVNLMFRIGRRVAETSVLTNTNAGEDERLIWTKIGDTVPVTYRIGKSGAIYINSWQAPPHRISLSR